MGTGMFDGMGEFLAFICVLAVIGLVLGIWKLVELIIWLSNHVQIV